jgi:hypothetical protein
MRASLAKICQRLEIEPDSEKAQEAAFTAKCSESLAWFDQDSCSWKTYQQSFLEGWEPYSETWPRSGMTRGGVAWKHQESERRIDATDGGCLQQWPTPMASDWNMTNNPRKDGRQNQLPNVVAMWPTPTVCGNHNRKGASAASGDGLATAVKMWPTPTVNDSKNMTLPPSQIKHDNIPGALLRDGEKAGGKLNPMWVEWLMGWPLGWTDSKHWATVKSRSKRQQPGKSSGVANA